MTKILNFESRFDYLGYEVNAATTCNPLNSFLLNCQLTVSESFSKWKGTVSMVCRAVPPLGAASILYNHFLGCFTPLGG